jgi:tRNA modification GTPase
MKIADSPAETIVAVATPPGRGALGVIRLSGPRAAETASPFLSFKRFSSLSQLPARQAVLAEFHLNATRLDQVVATLYRAPHSYTGEDMLEISCHGSGSVLRQAVAALVKGGARLAEPGEFSQRAFLNGKMDLSQAEAVADLIHAETEASRAAALSQLEGGLSGEISALRARVLQVLAHLEVDLDHSDDSTVGRTRTAEETRAELEAVAEKTRALAASFDYGRLLRDGVRVAIVGKPNAGKSSLLNRLLRSDRAIVTAVPGTTRDTIEEGFDLLGLPAVLVDTAGIRGQVPDLAERVGIERTLKALERSDAAIALLDGSRALTEEDRRVAELTRGKSRLVVALNKSDLPSQTNADEAGKLFARPALPISAQTGDGVDALLVQLKGLLSPESVPETSGSVLVTSLRHRQCLERAEQALGRALALRGDDWMEECLAVELHSALDAFGEIVGETVSEDVLDEIFSKFCIGK